MGEYDIKPNSHKYKEEQKAKEQTERKKLDKVVSGTVKTRKKSFLEKASDVFISEDASHVKSYILQDVLIPAAKKAISDIVTNGIDMVLYGETGHSKKNNNNNGYISYRNYADPRDRRPVAARTAYSFEGLVYDNRREAETVLQALLEQIREYGVATVADLYDFSGVSCNYTDNKYGWMSLKSADDQRSRDGYIIKLPRPMAID